MNDFEADLRKRRKKRLEERRRKCAEIERDYEAGKE